MPAPDVADVMTFLGDTEFDEPEIELALAAEKAAQATRCRVPADDADWPADLAEALCRRVMRNLKTKALPLGVEPFTIDDVTVATTRVGSDFETKRLEAPYRRLVVG